MFLSVTGTVKAEDGVEVGNFRIDGGQLNADYRYASGVLTILSDQTLTIKNKNPATATTDRIVIPENVKANLIFAGVNIKTSANSPFTLTPDANGDGKIDIDDISGMIGYVCYKGAGYDINESGKYYYELTMFNGVSNAKIDISM